MKGTLHYQGTQLCEVLFTVVAPSPDGMVALPEQGDMVLRLANEEPDEPHPQQDALGGRVAQMLSHLVRDSRVTWPVAIEFAHHLDVRGTLQVQQWGGDVLRVPLHDDMGEAVRGAVGCQQCGATWEALASRMMQPLERHAVSLPSASNGASRYKVFSLCIECSARRESNEAEFPDELKTLREALGLLEFAKRQRAFAPRLESPQ